MVAAKLQLEVDQLDADVAEDFLQDRIDLEGHLRDRIDLFLCRKAQCKRHIRIDQRIAQIIVLIAEFQRRALQLGTLRYAQTLGKAAGCLIADDDLQRNDLHFLDDRASLIQLLDIMCRDPFLLQDLAEIVAHAVVDDALADDRSLLETVERCRIILVSDDQPVVILRLEHFLRFSFVHHF